ncbi:MerR family transcriptional regulator [Streptomyces sp. NPDC002740]
MTAGDCFGRLDDDGCSADPMGCRVAEMLGAPQGFPRAIGTARRTSLPRSGGGQRPYPCPYAYYSRYRPRIAARARELAGHNTPVEAACRIVILEGRLEEARRIDAEHRRAPSRHTVDT